MNAAPLWDAPGITAATHLITKHLCNTSVDAKNMGLDKSRMAAVDELD